MADLEEPTRVIVAITGASGIGYGVRALELLRQARVETHLVITRSGVATIGQETDLSVAEIKDLASVVHSTTDLGASISSGSFPVAGMLVAPCSVRTLSGIANSYDENLVVRAADVTLKERRRLVLLLRESPLHIGHLRLMTQATEAGAVIMPPVPAFYTRPTSVEEIVDNTVHRALDLLGLPQVHHRRWVGERRARESTTDELAAPNP
ncbi:MULTISPECIES: UbiX family flavin prenyltransferase [unclassified Nocardioides]|uniref:UbiX family flavin prenyltransferase n=1 Tax=unclassified Nocardioides TaxID=2615069 RepID=UPI0009F0AD64|nr:MULTISPECIES: UbiX family flavin prenyltransferase [unclassified Nocardioides]GAW51825.1 3-octaprenyl-4-hydroxybenzoate carboxy-lyase [Nocardioides sp. PD653-B2]GAW53521.1 3-octaprenyl-4-hydroxybenzoate carboxy-lyase [Nocardioides sp. PD653]